MSDRMRSMLIWPIAGALIFAAFGVGLVAMAAYRSGETPGGAEAGRAPQVLDVELGELLIDPAKLQAEPGPLTLRVHNGGATDHNFSLGTIAATDTILPGQTVELEVPTLDPGTYEYRCTVSGHYEGGMKGVLTVGAGGGTVAAQHGNMSAEEMAAHDATVTEQFPAETEGRGGRPLRPRIVGGVKVFEVTAAPVQWETEPGKVVEAWVYNGMVPGPRITAELGDRVRIVLTNELPEPTTIHFHGLTVPAEMDGVPVISQDAVLPGESFVYEFTVRNTGTHMYHSHFNAQKQVPMGLLGAFVVPDPADPVVDVDYPMILNDGPLGFTLNGKGFPATQPLAVKDGQTVRIRYMNEGLQVHPMHLHGMSQTVIAVDGALLDEPYVADTVMVAPGSRVDVLVKATEPGTWAWHCHILSHAESEEGMFGMVTAMIVE